VAAFDRNRWALSVGIGGRIALAAVGELPSIARTTAQEVSKAAGSDCFATFPLVDVLPHAGAAVVSLTAPFYSHKVEEIGLFTDLRKQLDRNLHEATRAESRGTSSKLVSADKHKGSPREIVSAYLHHTPFQELLYAPIPFTIT
jgi:hypothetical protein